MFTDFFRMPENLLKLYQVLHPEDENVTISDLHDITVENVLKEYLESREKEVVDMLMTLFDEEQIMKNHDANLTREVLLANIKSIMEKMSYTAEQAMDVLDIPSSERTVLLEKI